MLPLYIFATILQVVLSSSTPVCEKDVEIKSIETKNPEDFIGNWKFVYHWDPNEKRVEDYKQAHPNFKCPDVTVTAADKDFVKEKAEKCAKYNIPFDWADVKVKIESPILNMNGAFLTLGEKDNWLVFDCDMMVTAIFRKFSDDFLVMSNPGKGNSSEMIARYLPKVEELDCIARNLDSVKGINGFNIC